MGANLIVRVADLTGVRLTAAADAIVAVPEPAAKIGGPIRFVLSDRGSRGRVGDRTKWAPFGHEPGPAPRPAAPQQRGRRARDCQCVQILESHELVLARLPKCCLS